MKKRRSFRVRKTSDGKTIIMANPRMPYFPRVSRMGDGKYSIFDPDYRGDSPVIMFIGRDKTWRAEVIN